MTSQQVIEAVERGRIIAILRGDFQQREVEIVGVLADAGITAVEMTINSVGVMEAITRLVERFGSRIAIGAGTVLSPDEVKQVADIGGSFIVSPNRNRHVIATTKQLGLASFPGCFTPSEVIEAFESGADAAKLFPAMCLGPAFVKAMRGPLPGARLVPTGGIDPEAARKYLAAGAFAVGVGSELIGADVLSPGGMDRLKARADAFVASVREK